jgi:prepilin-type N-terminal cleavage/methylation domain-containing protein
MAEALMRNTAMLRRRGFTLLEIMVAVSIIGLLAVMALPHVRKAWWRAREGSFINDLRIVAYGAIEQYAIAHGSYPVDAPVGVIPPGVEDYLGGRVDWSEETPIGGRWDWDRAPSQGEKINGCYAGLSVVGPQRTSAQMRDVDARIDDGDLSAGRFRATASGYICVVEE